MAENSTDQSPSGIKIYTSNPLNLVKTGLLVLTWLVLVGFVYSNKNFFCI